MAKSRRRGPKARNVFHIASQKHLKGKSRAKPVTTNLKKINIVNNEKINRMNEAFVDIQKELAHFSRSLRLEPLQEQRVGPSHVLLKLKVPQQCPEHKPVNVDEATRLMAQL